MKKSEIQNIKKSKSQKYKQRVENSTGQKFKKARNSEIQNIRESKSLKKKQNFKNSKNQKLK